MRVELPPSRSGARRALWRPPPPTRSGSSPARDEPDAPPAQAGPPPPPSSRPTCATCYCSAGGVAILGIDPGFRAGANRVHRRGGASSTAASSTRTRRSADAATRTLRALVERHGVRVIAIGDGTASQETCELVADAMNEAPAHIGGGVQLSVVSEAGASVYSVTDAAKKAEPSLDVGAIGAASLARRLQDPLAELVKIDPKAVGVGMYQHDVAPKALEEELAAAVESAVCRVGVDLNTASVLLCRVPGLTPRARRSRAPAGGYGLRGAPRRQGAASVKEQAVFLRLPSERAAERAAFLDCTGCTSRTAWRARSSGGSDGVERARVGGRASSRRPQVATRAAARADLAAAAASASARSRRLRTR